MGATIEAFSICVWTKVVRNYASLDAVQVESLAGVLIHKIADPNSVDLESAPVVDLRKAIDTFSLEALLPFKSGFSAGLCETCDELGAGLQVVYDIVLVRSATSKHLVM